VAVNVAELPLQIDAPLVLTVGVVFTVSVTEAVAVQLLASFTVTVYVFVDVGLAVGLCNVEEFKPVDGDHE